MSDDGKKATATFATEGWARIKAYLDNTISIASVDGPSSVFRMGRTLQIRISDALDSTALPDSRLSLDFSPDELSFLYAQVKNWVAVAELNSGARQLLGRSLLLGLEAPLRDLRGGDSASTPEFAHDEAGEEEEDSLEGSVQFEEVDEPQIEGEDLTEDDLDAGTGQYKSE